MHLTKNRYGKSRVRVARVVRGQDRHEFHEMTVAIRLEGRFEASYIEGDNRQVLPTDTMKNTVYALAADPAVAQPESFGLLLGRHFLNGQPQVSRATIELQSHAWQRQGPHCFIAGGQHQRLARVRVGRDGESVQSGVKGYLLLKTKGSGFAGYITDRFTTLKETSDRIFATSLDALWRYREIDDTSWDTCWHAVMKLITDTFAAHDSKAVQQTLYVVGEAVLAECPHISEIRLTMPNKHYLPVDLTPFGMANRNEVFCPTDEPHGLIEAVLTQ